MRSSARKSIFSALVGVLISLTNTFIQFLMIYWILKSYGTEFNGFIKITTSLSILGGTAEGALGISTIILMMKPIADHDYIAANEIYSTTKQRYHNGLVKGTILIGLISILYPLEIMLFPVILNGAELPAFSEWGITVTKPNGGTELVHIFEMVGVIFIFGFKQVVTVSFYGVYENVLQADQKNAIRRIVILFTDVIVYGILFTMLNLSVVNSEMQLKPFMPFLILLLYPFIRGIMIKMYVKRHYPWLKFYGDFNNFKLRRKASKMFWANLGQNILINIDIIILLIVLGTSGLRITSMLSLYMIIGVNLRLIMTNLITSFREYFLAITIKEGRLQWEAYSKYELYTFIIAALTFVMMSSLAPYLVTGIYGQIVLGDLNTITTASMKAVAVSSETANQVEAFKFIFTSPWFSMLYAGSLVGILLFQGQMTLIQAKGVNSDVSKAINIIAIVYVIFSLLTTLIIAVIAGNFSGHGANDIKLILIVFYSIKILFMTIGYIYLWFFTWRKVTYNSSIKYVFSNFLSLITPIILSMIMSLTVLSKIAPLEITGVAGSLAIKSPVTIGMIATITATTSFSGLAASLITPLIFRPRVGLSIIMNLPILKQIFEKQKEQSRAKRLLNENINISTNEDQKEIIIRAINGFGTDDKELNEEEFAIKYKFKEKPKVYKLKGTKIAEK